MDVITCVTCQHSPTIRVRLKLVTTYFLCNHNQQLLNYFNVIKNRVKKLLSYFHKSLLNSQQRTLIQRLQALMQKLWKLIFPNRFIERINPIPAGVLENQDTLGGGQFDPPPLNPMFNIQIWQMIHHWKALVLYF